MVDSKDPIRKKAVIVGITIKDLSALAGVAKLAPFFEQLKRFHTDAPSAEERTELEEHINCGTVLAFLDEEGRFHLDYADYHISKDQSKLLFDSLKGKVYTDL